jgi:hypothetical protein
MKTGSFARVLMSVAVSLALAEMAVATTHYVNPNSPNPTSPYTSWSTAAHTLPSALAVVQDNDEVWVVSGIYSPSTQGSSFTFPNVDRLAILGGFSGTENFNTERNPDPATNGTVLSGDLNSDDTLTVTSNVPSFGNRSDNCTHVVIFSQFSLNQDRRTLDGFTIKGGEASGSSSGLTGFGGGIVIHPKQHAARPQLHPARESRQRRWRGGLGTLWGEPHFSKL